MEEVGREVVYGITSPPMDHVTSELVLRGNRGHWNIKICHAAIDWNFDEDRCQILTGFGPENSTRLRRFAIGLLKDKLHNETTPEMMKKLMLINRAVLQSFGYLNNDSKR
jgi:hypothetical protein